MFQDLQEFKAAKAGMPYRSTPPLDIILITHLFRESSPTIPSLPQKYPFGPISFTAHTIHSVTDNLLCNKTEPVTFSSSLYSSDHRQNTVQYIFTVSMDLSTFLFQNRFYDFYVYQEEGFLFYFYVT